MATPPIHFVVSAPRSGSTWLARSLNLHPEVFATEQRLFGEHVDLWSDRRGGQSLKITQDAYVRNLAGYYFFDELQLEKQDFIRQMQDHLIQQVAEFGLRHTGKKLLVDKITPYSGTAERVLRSIRRRLPESRVIQLVRDGRDVATSGTFDWLHLNSAGTERHAFFVEQAPGMRLTRFFDDRAIEQWATDWRDVVNVFESHPPDLAIRYEAMKADHGQELKRIFQLLDVDLSAEIIESCVAGTTFQRATGRAAGDERPLEKARKGIAGDWKNYFTKRDAELFQQIAGQQLLGLGYVSDDSWVDSLPDELDLPAPGD
ncbi:MAG: sulfotransferase domain-containing protein [Planctomycetota bacterium]|nr:sulfotransferase domain-containing protein [Planctomycetota bacterium]